MLPRTLNGKALRHLRALGHALDPVIAVGKAGVTAAVAKETQTALEKHELVKVRVMREAPEDRKATAEDLAHKTGAVLAQVLGRTFLLYKRHATRKVPKIVLPKPGPDAPPADG
jgi:RNA-binding protein